MNASRWEKLQENLKRLASDILGLFTFPLQIPFWVLGDLSTKEIPLWKKIRNYLLGIPLGLILWVMVWFVLVPLGIILLSLVFAAFIALTLYEFLWAERLGRHFLKKVPSPISFRGFRIHYDPTLDELILTSCYFPVRWERPTLKADLAPRENNKHGIHAFKDQRTLYEELPGLRTHYASLILGKLEQHGALCFHTQGCRSEWGTIWELALSLCSQCGRYYADFLVYSNLDGGQPLKEGRETCLLCTACLALLKEEENFILEKSWTAWEIQEILGERFDCPVHPAPWWHMQDYDAFLQVGEVTLRVAPGEPNFEE